MKTPNRAPIFKQDQSVFVSLWKKICLLAAAAAGLGPDFVKFSRHFAEFGAICCGSTNCQRLFAEVASRPPAIPADVTRQYVASCFEAGIKRGAGKLADDGDISRTQAAAIVSAAASIVEAVSKDLQYLEVDRFTFERNILDPMLISARAPKYEYAVTKDGRSVFSFPEARRLLLEVAGQDDRAVLDKVTAERLQHVLRKSMLPLAEATEKGWVPLTHFAVIFSDDTGHVVGGSFQHPVHLGIVPVCCADPEHLWAVGGALNTSMQAQMQHGSNWTVGFDDPTNIRPYFPTGRFPSMFNSAQDDDGPPVYYSQVPMEKAVEYLTALANAVNGKRVRCLEPEPQLLKGATLTSTTLYSAAKEKRNRTYWGLRSAQSTPGQSKVMAASGTTGGLTGGSQWYLRQIYWLDEAEMPELRTSSDHFLAQDPNFDTTKIIPDGIEDFTRRALEHLSKMPKDQQRSDAAIAVASKLQDQKKLLQKVKDEIKADAIRRAEAGRVGLAAVGPEVLPPAN